MNIILAAQAAIETPEVVALVKQLSHYGLGVFAPHEHGDDNGFRPLEANRVQYESNRSISFVDADVPEVLGTVATGWRWGGAGLEVIAACKVPHY